LTIKSTSHTTCPYLPAELRRLFGQVDATSSRFYACVCNARQYSVVKDLDCVSNQLSARSTDG